MSTLGKRLTRSLIEEKDLSKLTEYNISSGDLSGEGRECFDWTRNYILSSGHYPTPSMVEESTKISLPEQVEPLDYVADLVRKRSISKELTSSLGSAAELIEDRKPEEALEAVMAAGFKILGQTSKGRVLHYTENAEARLQSYIDGKKKENLPGVETLWESINNAIQCWVNGCLHVVAAMQNTGKSWWLCISAADAMKKGKKVLFITMEMDNFHMARRIDAISHKIPFGKLRGSTFTESEEKALIHKMGTTPDGAGDIVFADKHLIRTVTDVTAAVMEHKPDIVLIDGGYKFEPSRKTNSQYEASLTVIMELERAALTSDIPWVVTTQLGDANETGKKTKGNESMRPWNMRYAKEWVINPPVVLGLYADEGLRLLNEMEVHFLKIRENDGDTSGNIRINWNMKEMDFSEITEDTPSPFGDEAATEGYQIEL